MPTHGGRSTSARLYSPHELALALEERCGLTNWEAGVRNQVPVVLAWVMFRGGGSMLFSVFFARVGGACAHTFSECRAQTAEDRTQRSTAGTKVSGDKDFGSGCLPSMNFGAVPCSRVIVGGDAQAVGAPSRLAEPPRRSPSSSSPGACQGGRDHSDAVEPNLASCLSKTGMRAAWKAGVDLAKASSSKLAPEHWQKKKGGELCPLHSLN